MKFRILPFLALLGLPFHAVMAQTASRPLNLDEVISLALNHSAIGKQANTDREIGYWQWRDYRSTYRPQLGLQGTLPNYSSTITPVVQPEDGSIVFRQIKNNNSNVGLAVRQNIGLTGGQVIVGADVLRYDDFIGKAKRYNSQPFTLGLTQPIGQFNELHWNRRIEPLRYQESQRQFLEEREKIAQRTTELYFDVLLQQVNAEVARQNAQATDELLRIGQERYRLGRLSQSDLLQLELNLLDAQQAKIQAQLSAQNATVELQAYTGLTGAPALDVPALVPQPVVAPEVALEQARQHRSAMLAFQRRLLEAERDVAQARGTTGMQATLSANLGYVNQAPELNNSLQDLRNQQQVKLSFSVPLLDWGTDRPW
ncbi:TolC family protein [Hymenobacter cellulosilyticus]|uniref:TolC family protein n=1 Tax=Hymenobacter cellulosilyticus TaxID=2932248 RepID=A0A8T9QAV8_9BACT|nr:TolC family protein [Hymenobacter cellulosilyticus]UOQ72940.1 TolC family protein [Hymenobacter cellulosilyticus]